MSVHFLYQLLAIRYPQRPFSQFSCELRNDFLLQEKSGLLDFFVVNLFVYLAERSASVRRQWLRELSY